MLGGGGGLADLPDLIEDGMKGDGSACLSLGGIGASGTTTDGVEDWGREAGVEGACLVGLSSMSIVSPMSGSVAVTVVARMGEVEIGPAAEEEGRALDASDASHDA
jgi:proteasome assembly chaperone (PAC2) family protein